MTTTDRETTMSTTAAALARHPELRGRIIYDDETGGHACTAHPDSQPEVITQDERGAALWRCPACHATRWSGL